MQKYWNKISLLFILLLSFPAVLVPSTTHASGRGAAILHHTIPSMMQAGVTYPVSVTVRNDSSEVWSEQNLIRLGDVGDSDPLSYGRKFIPNGQIVSPGQTITFSFTMTAPTTTGSYITDWRMVKENVEWFGDTVTVNVSVVSSIPSSSATLMYENIPSVMAKGHKYPVTLAFRNDGGDTWSPEEWYRLGGAGDQDPFANTRQIIPDGRRVKPGEVQSFTFIMQAPAETGAYMTDWGMVHDGVTWFGQTFTKNVQVVEGTRNARVVTHSIPSTMELGQSYNVTVTMRNEGETSWYEEGTAPGMYRLGAAGDNDPFAQGRYYLPPGTIIRPGEEYTFAFTMTAPAVPGTYITDWGMLQEYVTWFGETLVKSVTVIDPSKTNTYTYDSSGRLQSVKLTSGQTVYYDYDANGNLIKKRVRTN
ncbi:NBR1-Ig-like domain-containing protein [Paenibacillus silagei]|uniref:YD repeat-containing protein n=1 Tax=Paenibacillus silagei TaxID=1670801 RepID=A0ABS4NY33_9BACL|nr:NBR1-Ig-like domain-containing protein [Paenibacillus silagei]MBP2114944.1 YD repeat-containing protein [Paenibacillus silagei]